jgi:RimJ/RimL family protein N-acetyltransferase
VNGGKQRRHYRVRLRRVTTEDVKVLELWASSSFYFGEFNDFGLPRTVPVAETIAATGLVGDERGALLIERVENGELVGQVSWHQVRYGPNPESAAWNIGISLIPQHRGRGYGGEAQRLLAEYLFERTPLNRVEASTDVENQAEQRALEKGGFQREGILRGAQYRAGAWRDLVSYSLLREAVMDDA